MRIASQRTGAPLSFIFAEISTYSRAATSASYANYSWSKKARCASARCNNRLAKFTSNKTLTSGGGVSGTESRMLHFSALRRVLAKRQEGSDLAGEAMSLA